MQKVSPIIYETKRRNWNAAFTCALDMQIGAYELKQGEPIRAISDGDGLYSIYVGWGDGAISRVDAEQVNRLAGARLIEPLCRGIDSLHCDDPNCPKHSAM